MSGRGGLTYQVLMQAHILSYVLAITFALLFIVHHNLAALSRGIGILPAVFLKLDRGRFHLFSDLGWLHIAIVNVFSASSCVLLYILIRGRHSCRVMPYFEVD